MKHDSEWRKYHFTDETLLEAILSELEAGKLIWPAVNLWIQNMRKNPNWYLINMKDFNDVTFAREAEDLLLSLASNYLERQIQLIPLFGKDIKSFGKSFLTTKPYRLLALQQSACFNTFFSVV